MFVSRVHLSATLAMHAPRCGRCAFPAPAGLGVAPSYAFALCHAADEPTDTVARVLQAANVQAVTAAVPGVSSYCSACRCVTWMTRHADVQDGLLQMRSDRARWVALHAALGPA